MIEAIDDLEFINDDIEYISNRNYLLIKTINKKIKKL